METKATSLDVTRHRLFEVILLRLARRQVSMRVPITPGVGEFVLRGGMLMRHWFRPIPRPAEDLDLIASFPFSVEEAAGRIIPLLADGASDGVAFDAESAHAEGMQLDTGPGVRVFASGVADGVEAEFHVDVTFGPNPRPAPVFDALPTACGEAARVWMCRPEAVAGHKMQALWNRGLLGWRPKDLENLRLLLTRVPMDSAELRGAVAGYLADVGATGEDARALFGPASWWGMKLSSARWLDFVRSSKRRDVPRDLATVVAEVVGRLTPILEGEETMSGSLAKGFLADIVSNIDDDTPRLVYADWLTENGQDDRAEFIRVQVERARLPAWDAAQVRLRLREQALLKLHGEEWLAELPAIEGARWEGFRRGIVAEASFASFEAMRQSAHACRAVAPVEAVTVRWPRKGEAGQADAPIAELRELSITGRAGRLNVVAWLADSPQLSTLRCLSARGLWAEGLARLVASPHLAGLKVLRLPSNNHLGNAGIRALIQAASLTALEELDLSGEGVSERYHDNPSVRLPGMESLAGWAGLATVRSLTLFGNWMGGASLRPLLRSPHIGASKLSLRGSGLDGQAMGEFGSARPGLTLQTLDLGENVLKELGAEYLALARCLGQLKELRLDRCEIPLAGARVLAKKAPFLDSLLLLDVGHNHFGPAGLDALLERKPPLHTLRMRDNDLFDKGAALLAGSPASDALLEVDLSQNSLGAAGALALGESAHLRGLLVLRLVDNSINELAAVHLTASPLGKRLAVLEFEEPPPAPDPPPAGDDAPPVPSPLPPGGDDIPF